MCRCRNQLDNYVQRTLNEFQRNHFVNLVFLNIRRCHSLVYTCTKPRGQLYCGHDIHVFIRTKKIEKKTIPNGNNDIVAKIKIQHLDIS